MCLSQFIAAYVCTYVCPDCSVWSACCTSCREVKSIWPVQLLRFQLPCRPCGHPSPDLVACPWTVQWISPSCTSPTYITFWGTQLLPPIPLPPFKKKTPFFVLKFLLKAKFLHTIPSGHLASPKLLTSLINPLTAPPSRPSPLGSRRHLSPGLLSLFSINIIIIISIFEAN